MPLPQDMFPCPLHRVGKLWVKADLLIVSIYYEHDRRKWRLEIISFVVLRHVNLFGLFDGHDLDLALPWIVLPDNNQWYCLKFSVRTGVQFWLSAGNSLHHWIVIDWMREKNKIVTRAPIQLCCLTLLQWSPVIGERLRPKEPLSYLKNEVLPACGSQQNSVKNSYIISYVGFAERSLV